MACEISWLGYCIAGVLQSIADEALHAVRGAELVQQRHALLHRRAVAAAEVAPEVLVVLVRASRFDLLMNFKRNFKDKFQVQLSSECIN